MKGWMYMMSMTNSAIEEKYRIIMRINDLCNTMVESIPDMRERRDFSDLLNKHIDQKMSGGKCRFDSIDDIINMHIYCISKYSSAGQKVLTELTRAGGEIDRLCIMMRML